MTITAFQTPSKLDLRPIQQALDNIRESLRTLDSRAGGTAKLAGQTAQAASQGSGRTAALQQQLYALETDLNVVKRKLAALIARDDIKPFLSIGYSYGDATPAPIGIVPRGMRVVSVEVAVDTGFDGAGAALSVGPIDRPRELAGDGIDAATAATFDLAPQVVYAFDTPVYLFITPGSGASRGAGAVLLQLQ